MTGEEITVRQCRAGDVPAVLDLWKRARSGHASTADRPDDVEPLVGDSPAALLVAFEDEGAASFWERAGYPLDHQIGRRVRNLTEPGT